MTAVQQLSRTEKLRMMETLWDDLAHDELEFASPAWHGEALKDTELAVATEQARFVDWETAKQALRDTKA